MPKRQTVLDFVRANPGCNHTTPGADFAGARLAALHRLLDAGKVRYERAPRDNGDGTIYVYFVRDWTPAPAPVAEPAKPVVHPRTDAALTAILQPPAEPTQKVQARAPWALARRIATVGAGLAAAEQPPSVKPAPKAHASVVAQNDADVSDRLARRVVRAAERWQRAYPCPPSADQLELHALWVAVEKLVAHDAGELDASATAHAARQQGRGQ